MGVGQELAGLGLFLGTQAVAAKLVYALRREAQVALDGHSSRYDGADGAGHLGPALELHSVDPRLLHDAHGIAHGLLAAHLVGAEGHVAHHKAVLAGAGHSAGIHDHLVDGDGEGGLVASHDVGGRVAYQYRVDAGTVDDACGGEVVGGELCYLLASSLHLRKCLSGNLFLVCC